MELEKRVEKLEDIVAGLSIFVAILFVCIVVVGTRVIP